MDDLEAAIGFELIQADEASSNRREAIIAGSLSTGRYYRCGCRTGANVATTGSSWCRWRATTTGLKDLAQYGIADLAVARVSGFRFRRPPADG